MTGPAALRGWTTLRALLYAGGFVLLWGWLVTLVRPLDRGLGGALPAALRVPGLVLAVAGAALALACVLLFGARGRGTPAPFDAPRVFVASGPYRYVRNPMYVGGLAVLAGVALWLRSPATLGLAAAFVGVAHLFVRLYEEPALTRQFGETYLAYRREVPRWLPRVRRGAPGAEIRRADAAPGFVSARDFTPTNLAARIRTAPWFARCGEPFSSAVSVPVETVGSWAAALAACAAPARETAQLEAGNQLSAWLSRHARDRYREWNDLIRRHQAEVVTPLTERVLRPVAEARGLDPVFVGAVEWDILHALMENSYLDTGHRAFFFLELLTVYEAGHYPCGWSGDWPEGRLLVF